MPYAKNYTADDRIALAGSAGVIFLVALIIITFITTRIADFIIDSRIGALDRTLGFLFWGSSARRSAARRCRRLLELAGRCQGRNLPGLRKPSPSRSWIRSLRGLETVLPTDIEPQIRARILGRGEAKGNEAAPSDEAPNAPVTNN